MYWKKHGTGETKSETMETNYKLELRQNNNRKNHDKETKQNMTM